MDEFLQALLSREALPVGSNLCQHCEKGVFAVWRCRDCVLATPMCRACMRQSHRENPFHRIQRWNGGYFRSAALWEVGTYLLVQHHTGEQICDTLKLCCNNLEKVEERRDIAEQEHLNRERIMPGMGHIPSPGPRSETFFEDNDISYADVEEDDPDGEDDFDGGSDVEDEHELENPYLHTADADAGASADAGSSFTFGNVGTYVRVVHSNGLHHIAMINCLCHGEDILPLDLFASQLLPASLKRIKTLFTAQVLDIFRLSNLELKASAYQFYQLLRRLTNPGAPNDVLNLYREFRRMSRLWRWMKKLKWAGYAGSLKNVNEVRSGELAIYCPACPQPGVNIPDNWKENSDRCAFQFISSILIIKSDDCTVGYINVSLWQMGILKLITSDKKMELTMCGYQRVVV